MRKAEVSVKGTRAGFLIEISNLDYDFIYDPSYDGPPVSLALPVKSRQFKFHSFPAFFEGLLPEGPQLEALLKQKKINRGDLFSQLIACGSDCVGAVTVKEIV